MAGIPQRTCVGCRVVADRAALVRLVRDERGILAIDARGAAAGRGAWLHRNRDCLRAAIAGGRFAKAFRRSVALLPHDQGGDATDRLWAALAAGSTGSGVTDGADGVQ